MLCKNLPFLVSVQYKTKHHYCLSPHRNAKGCTPFMQAICCQAYAAAVTLMDTAKRLASSGAGSSTSSGAGSSTSSGAGSSTSSGTGSGASQEMSRTVFMSMLYPPNSSLGNSPLHVVCCNDTCSFTWTGAEHINQVRSRSRSR